MTDEIVPPRNRGRRKGGGVWTPRNEAALKGDGAYCKNCRRRHGYMTMDVKYEKRKDGWWVLWICHLTGLLIEEVEPTQKKEEETQNDKD